MKKNFKTILLIVTITVTLVFAIWANVIMRNYDGYLEIFKAARHAAMPQTTVAIIAAVISYALLIIPNKRK